MRREALSRILARIGLFVRAVAGIVSAAKQEREAIWCVADLAAAPFRNRSFDAILNILSPSNYAEFERLLSDDGIVLKVIPRSGHLKELRRFLYGTYKAF